MAPGDSLRLACQPEPHAKLATEGRHAVADLVTLLIAVDTRKLWAEGGCSSIFRFCVQRLRLSEEEAHYRNDSGGQPPPGLPAGASRE